MIYIATTTINKPTRALKLFSKNKSETNLCHDQMLDLQSFMS